MHIMPSSLLSLPRYLVLGMMLLLSGPHGLGKYLDETTLADRGYVGLGLVYPDQASVWAAAER